MSPWSLANPVALAKGKGNIPWKNKQKLGKYSLLKVRMLSASCLGSDASGYQMSQDNGFPGCDRMFLALQQ